MTYSIPCTTKTVRQTIAGQRILTAAGLAIAAAVFAANPSQAFRLGVENITGNTAANAAAGERQLFVDITEDNNGDALFTFSNLGPDAASITQIYWDNGSGVLDAILGLDNSDSGVLFELPRRVGNLPGGNQPGVNFTEDFSVEPVSRGGTQRNGINPNESLGVTFGLTGSFNDLIGDLNNGDVRVGFHVQGFGDGGSESFVNLPNWDNLTTPRKVPEPGTVTALGVFALSILGLSRNQTLKRK